MGGMKTFASRLLIGISGWLPAQAAASDTRVLRTFATCVGQLSAKMEFQWLTDGPGSERTKTQRAAVIELLRAVMTEDDARQVLVWRIEAKAAHAALLTRTLFNDDAADAAWARQVADAQAARCTGMLLG